MIMQRPYPRQLACLLDYDSLRLSQIGVAKARTTPNNLEESGTDFSLREVLQLIGGVEIAATPVWRLSLTASSFQSRNRVRHKPEIDRGYDCGGRPRRALRQ
jgi:hypothetical protein